MKKFIFVLLGFAIMGLMVSCDKDTEVLPASQESLIENITKAGDVDLLAPEKVPTQIHNFVEENYQPYQIEMAFHARGLGYEMMLENGLCIFFDNNGAHLNHDGMHNDWSNAHRGGYHCMLGDTLDVDMIPVLVQSFIADNYPDLTIRFVVLKPSGKLCVELSDDLILMFGTNGELITECQAFSTGNGNGHHAHNHSFGTSSGAMCDSIIMQGGGGHPGSGSAMLKNSHPEVVREKILTLIQGNQPASVQISDIMSFPVVTALSGDTMEEVAFLLRKKGCTGVPVLKNDELVGIISRRDFRKIKKTKQMKSPVKAYMSRKIVTIAPGKSPTKAARLMVKYDVGRLPVVKNDRVIGIVTRSDTMLYFYDQLPV